MAYKYGDAVANIGFSDLAKRGGALTFSFPHNWYGFGRRNDLKSSSLQGWMGWKYGFSRPNGRKVEWYHPTNHQQPGNAGTLVARNAGIPGGSNIFPFIASSGSMHPHGGGYICHNVIRWKAPYTGVVRMLFSIHTTHHAGGNGIIFWVAKMSKDGGPASGGNVKGFMFGPKNIFGINSPGKWHAGIGSRWPSFTGNKTVSVTKGDTFYCVVGPDTSPNYDSLDVNWDIYYENHEPLTGANLSLREMTEDMARTQVIMPNYRYGQTKDSSLKFADNGGVHSDATSGPVHVRDWIDTTWIPHVVNHGYHFDTTVYNQAGNGSLFAHLYYSMAGAQWWNWTSSSGGKNVGGVIEDASFQLRNLSPPPGVSFTNGVEGQWQVGAYSAALKAAAPHVQGPTARWTTQPWVAFTGLVGGTYALDYALNWKTPWGKYEINFDANSCLKPNNMIIEKHLVSNYGHSTQR
jgi:hypothetical protein